MSLSTKAVPKQLVPSVAEAHKKAIEIMEDTLLEKDQEENIVCSKKIKFRDHFLDAKWAYLERAKTETYTGQTSSQYFQEENDLTYKLALTSKTLIRLGFDITSEVFKVFMKRENLGPNNPKPSIIKIPLTEIKEIIEIYNMDILPQIQSGVSSGKLEFKTNFKPTQEDFWEDGFCTESGSVRLRPFIKCGKIYNFYINNPAKPTELYPKNFGTKIAFSKPEIEKLFDIFKNILSKCPDLELISKN